MDKIVMATTNAAALDFIVDKWDRKAGGDFKYQKVIQLVVLARLLGQFGKKDRREGKKRREDNIMTSDTSIL